MQEMRSGFAGGVERKKEEGEEDGWGSLGLMLVEFLK